MPLSELNAKLLENGVNKHDRCIVLIKAFLDEAGPSTGREVRAALSACGINDEHARIILSKVAQDKSAPLRWGKGADGLYVDVN